MERSNAAITINGPQVNYEWNQRKKEGTLNGDGGGAQAAYVPPASKPQPVAQGTVVAVAAPADAPPAYAGAPPPADAMGRA